MTDKQIQEEQNRLKNRRRIYEEKYRKGIFYRNPEQLIALLKEAGVIIRMHSTGALDDDTCFMQISIEGFKHFPE